MTILQKLDLFEKRTSKFVEQQRKEVAQEIQEQIKSAVKEAKEATRCNADDQIKSEKYKLEREANKMIYKAETQAKQALSNLQKNIETELFTDLEKDLRDFVSTTAYKDFLLEGIASVMQHNLPSIQLMTKDMTYKTPIEEGTAFKVKETEEDFIGGFRLMSDKAVMDYTLLGELNGIRENFWHKWPGNNG